MDKSNHSTVTLNTLPTPMDNSGEIISDLSPELPDVRQDRPNYFTLMQLLDLLEKKPSSWTTKSSTDVVSLLYGEEAINKFLLDVIRVNMRWLRDVVDEHGIPISADEQKENLMNIASIRIVERCGRSAQGEMQRSWVIPAAENNEEFIVEIREPSFTADNLGHKTWGTSYSIAKKLNEFGKMYFGELLGRRGTFASPTGHMEVLPSARVLELGAGTGLIGIAAAGVWGTLVVLTDMEEIVPNLAYNINLNANIAVTTTGRLYSEVLNWAYPELALQEWHEKEFDIILATDPLYDESHPGMLSWSIAKFLSKNQTSRVLVAVPMRNEATIEMISMLERFMQMKSFVEIASGEEICLDDWDSKDGTDVIIRWIIWRWSDEICNNIENKSTDTLSMGNCN